MVANKIKGLEDIARCHVSGRYAKASTNGTRCIYTVEVECRYRKKEEVPMVVDYKGKKCVKVVEDYFCRKWVTGL